MDGRYAVSTSDVKVLTGSKLYSPRPIRLFETTAVRESAYSYISRIGGGFQVSAHIPDVTATKKAKCFGCEKHDKGSRRADLARLDSDP